MCCLVRTEMHANENSTAKVPGMLKNGGLQPPVDKFPSEIDGLQPKKEIGCVYQQAPDLVK